MRHTCGYAAGGIAGRVVSCRYIQARMRGWSDIYEGVGLAVAQMIMYSSQDAVASYATRPRLRHFDPLYARSDCSRIPASKVLDLGYMIFATAGPSERWKLRRPVTIK